MDNREQPVQQTVKPLVQDINHPGFGAMQSPGSLPQPSVAQPTVQPSSNPIVAPQSAEPQVVDDIPLRQPSAAVPPVPHRSQPVQSQTQPAGPEDELEKILRAVNNRVSSAPSTKSNKFQLGQKFVETKSKVKAKTATPKPVVPIAIAVLIFIVLSVAAIFAYQESTGTVTAAKIPGKVGTSYTASSAIQQAGGTLVSPGDLDSFAQTLQNQLNSLNDQQDFDAHSLSSQSLGL